MRNTGIVAPLMLLSMFLVSGCDDRGPTAPSPPSVPSPVPAQPVPTDVWNITVRLTTVSGGDCVGETMQSEIGVPKSYSLTTVTKDGTVEVTLKSASGDYACTFSARAESDGFTTLGVPGFYSCTTSLGVSDFVCANGIRRDIVRFGQNISGRISGNEVSGRWDVEWEIWEPGSRSYIGAVDTTAQYTGNR
ncbi:MAG TPA: hypothetical protein VFO67_11635 [Gemmatimonadales bacterium]|nr:hypothetical protein [Gemmatimonadales bacterium]